MNVAMLSCHVRREMQVCDVMLQNTLSWLHGCSMGLVLGGSLGTKPCVFLGQVVPVGDGRYLGCATGAAGVVLTLFGSSSVFCNEWCVVCM